MDRSQRGDSGTKNLESKFAQFFPAGNSVKNGLKGGNYNKFTYALVQKKTEGINQCGFSCTGRGGGIQTKCIMLGWFTKKDSLKETDGESVCQMKVESWRRTNMRRARWRGRRWCRRGWTRSWRGKTGRPGSSKQPLSQHNHNWQQTRFQENVS